jgi:hypothetical protein
MDNNQYRKKYSQNMVFSLNGHKLYRRIWKYRILPMRDVGLSMEGPIWRILEGRPWIIVRTGRNIHKIHFSP